MRLGGLHDGLSVGEDPDEGSYRIFEALRIVRRTSGIGGLTVRGLDEETHLVVARGDEGWSDPRQDSEGYNGEAPERPSAGEGTRDGLHHNKASS